MRRGVHNSSASAIKAAVSGRLPFPPPLHGSSSRPSLRRQAGDKHFTCNPQCFLSDRENKEINGIKYLAAWKVADI